MSVLIIGEAQKEAARRLFEFAMRPENHYKPGPGVGVPGDDPNYVLQLFSYRCVFTITESASGVYKHLSISVPAKDKLPHPAAVEEIAHLFGIKGSVDDWASKGHVSPHANEHCVVVVSEFKP
jgi:hypothetical protein